MPIVDQDNSIIPKQPIKNYPQTPSLRQLREILDKYPRYYQVIDPRLTEINDYHLSTKGGIHSFQFNKIRIALASIQKKHGYPVRQHHTVAFFDLMMFSIPFFTKIFTTLTIQMWDAEIIPAGMYLWENTYDHTKSFEWRFRKVIIHNIPNEFSTGILNFIPFKFDEAVWGHAQRTTSREWFIFDNLLSYGGLNNLVIIANWNRIRNFIDNKGVINGSLD